MEGKKKIAAKKRLFLCALACAFVVSAMAGVDSAQAPQTADAHAKRMAMASQLGHTHAGMSMAMSTGGSSQSNESDVRKAESYPLNMNHLADNVAQTNLLSVLVTNGQRMTLKLAEFDNFIGNHTYITTGPNGTRLSHPFLGRSFGGSLVSDSNSHATLLIAPEGLYGSLQTQGKVWSFQPKKDQGPPSNGTIVQEVATYTVPPAAAGNSGNSTGSLPVPLPPLPIPPLPSNTSSAPKPHAPNPLSPKPASGAGAGGGSGSASHEDTSQGVVTLYEHCNFQGWTAAFGVGIFNLADIQTRGGQNDQASAVGVTGSTLTVTLYEHDHQGGQTLTLGPGDTACLVPYNFNDITSSLVVESSSSGNNGGGQGSGLVTLYQHCDYQGWTASFGVGTFNLADIQSRGGQNDEASAVAVSSGVTVTLYENNYEGGQQLQLGPGSYTCLVDYSFNDLTSSILVSSRGVSGGNGGYQLWVKPYADYDYPRYAFD